MATSPNYGWLEPDNTDLVKNGALAIRTLGNAIDTTMATMTPKSLVDAKGDLVTATANDTPARLAVGADGSTLVANSAASTGLSWAGQPYMQPILNSAFQIWQRGTSIALTTTAYTADRWQGYRAVSGSTVSRQTTSDTTNLPNIQYCARVQRDSGNTATNTIYFGQSIETVNSIPFAGKTVTLSFYARAGANYSSASNALSVAVATGTGTDQNLITVGYTGNAYVINTTATLTTTWQRFTYTATLGTSITEVGLQLSNVPVGTAGAADYYEITGVQIDLGSVALPFRTAYGTIAGELAACQRYYYRQTATTGTSSNYSGMAFGFNTSTTGSVFYVKTPATMRTVPTSVDYSTLCTSDIAAANFTVTNLALSGASSTTDTVVIETIVASGQTQYRPAVLRANNSTSAYLGFSAEL